jgi:hypothetical protein
MSQERKTEVIEKILSTYREKTNKPEDWYVEKLKIRCFERSEHRKIRKLFESCRKIEMKAEEFYLSRDYVGVFYPDVRQEVFKFAEAYAEQENKELREKNKTQFMSGDGVLFYCDTCGEDVEPDYLYCPYCGRQKDGL